MVLFASHLASRGGGGEGGPENNLKSPQRFPEKFNQFGQAVFEILQIKIGFIMNKKCRKRARRRERIVIYRISDSQDRKKDR